MLTLVQKIFKSLIYNKLYLKYYPLSANAETNCKKLNETKLNDNSSESELLYNIISFIKLATLDSDILLNSLKKNQNKCYKTKKIKKKDENGNKYKEVEESIKWSLKDREEEYKALKTETMEWQDKLKMLNEHIESRTIDKADLEIIDKLLFENRNNKWFEIAIISFIFILMMTIIVKNVML